VRIKGNTFTGPTAVLGSGVQHVYPGGAQSVPQFSAVPSSLRTPFVEPSHVCGRVMEIAKLGKLVAAGPGSAVGRLAVVTGPGGIGKTWVLATAVGGAVGSGCPPAEARALSAWLGGLPLAFG
jgi:hypothetical protein